MAAIVHEDHFVSAADLRHGLSDTRIKRANIFLLVVERHDDGIPNLSRVLHNSSNLCSWQEQRLRDSSNREPHVRSKVPIHVPADDEAAWECAADPDRRIPDDT